MRVLQIGLEWFPEHGGGLDRYFQELIERAAAFDIDARGFVAGRASVAKESGGLVSSFAPRTASLTARLLAARQIIGRELTETGHDLVAAHFAMHTFPLLDRLKIPLVVHFQGPWADESLAQGSGTLSSCGKRWIERSVYRRAERCVVLSQAFKALLVERYGVAEQKVIVCPGAVDTARFANVADSVSRIEARRMLGWPQDRPILLAVRRLVKRMGLDHLVDAVACTARRHPDLLLMLAGRGPEEQALAAHVERAGMAANIRLLGFVSDEALPLAYRAADLSVTPTQSLEGFGLITVEAMATGTPAMVTAVGGLPEIVRPLAPDLVLPHGDAETIAEGLCNWLDGRLQIPDETACRTYADAHFSWSTTLQRLRNIYQDAIS